MGGISMTEKPRDWSEKDLRRMIIDQRRFLWRDDTIDRIALSSNLKQGMTAVDAGCGLGYLGWTFWRHFGEGGTYIGVDCSEKLLGEALGLAEEWGAGGITRFLCGAACSLPLPDGCSDLTMCQTLLMHLSAPEEALAEMVRVTKPGGAVLCLEPDNITAMISIPYGSARERSIEEHLARAREQLFWAEGMKRLGKGDWAIGRRIPWMMAEAGLVRIQACPNDQVSFVQPPYETEVQKHRLDLIRKGSEEMDPEAERRHWRDYRKCYLAGGGSRSSFYRMKRKSEAEREPHDRLLQEQIGSGTFFQGQGPATFFCFTGFVPG
jgi:ubiquinone/menaquinone biosynthesis C-methylase UbiE